MAIVCASKLKIVTRAMDTRSSTEGRTTVDHLTRRGAPILTTAWRGFLESEQHSPFFKRLRGDNSIINANLLVAKASPNGKVTGKKECRKLIPVGSGRGARVMERNGPQRPFPGNPILVLCPNRLDLMLSGHLREAVGSLTPEHGRDQNHPFFLCG